jgi:hypothetical protein
VITWFQNRRAKLKRDLEELKADVTATTEPEDGEDKATNSVQVSKNNSVNVAKERIVIRAKPESSET